MIVTFVRFAAAVMLAAPLLQGCSPKVGASADAGMAGAGPPGPAGPTPTAGSESERTSFSAVVNGKLVKGDRVTPLGTNRASITPEGSEIHEIIFGLAPTSNDQDAQPEFSLRFNFPVKVGSYDLMGTDIAACNNCSVVLAQSLAPFGEYSPQKMQVSITSLTPTRIAGTFSGTLELSYTTPDRVRKVAPPIMRVENGQFDIPIAQP